MQKIKLTNNPKFMKKPIIRKKRAANKKQYAEFAEMPKRFWDFNLNPITGMPPVGPSIPSPVDNVAHQVDAAAPCFRSLHF